MTVAYGGDILVKVIVKFVIINCSRFVCSDMGRWSKC
jgi:hypothetical protein